MKKLMLAVCSVVVTCACGSGGGGGGGGGAPPPSAPPIISVSISPATQVNIDQGQTVNFTAIVLNDTNSKGVTWSASGTGVTGTECGAFSNATTTTATYNAPSTVSANLNITITATSVADTTKSASVAVTVTPPPSITTKTLTEATPNANYSATLEATGGAGTLTWSLASGTLPTGLSLSSSGAITGDPTASGTSTFTVQVADSSAAPSGPATAQAQLSLTVVTAVSITTTALPAGSEGIAYLAGVDASGGTPPYTWSLAIGSLPPGLTMPPGSGVISGVPTSQGTFTFTVAAQDSSPTKQTQTQSLAIAIGAPGPLAITTFSLIDGTLNTPYNAKVVALGGTPPYTWSIPTGGLPAGVSLGSSTGAISGTPSSTGTSAFTIVVVDSSSPAETQSQALSMTVANPAEACTSSGNNAVLDGLYAFSLSGFNDVGFLTIVGSFAADGTGKITAGEADTNGVLGAQNGKLITSASSYSAGSDNRGCATLATPFGTFVTHFALGSISSKHATAARMIEWDSPSASAYIASGQLLGQSSSAFAGGPTGSYVFRTVGWDPSSLGGRDVCVGVLNAGENAFTALEEDCNDAWTLSTSSAPALAGAYTAIDANGRGTGIITLGDSNFNITLYMVSSSQLLVVNADPGPFASGEWDQQSVPAGGAGFTQASLDGNMVLYLSGLSLGGTATTVSMETASADGSSSLAITFYEDRAGTLQVSATDTCTYTVEPNGRVTLGSVTQSCGSNPPVFYLAGLNTGFIVDTAPGVDAGSFEPQSAGPFNNASLSGNFFGGIAEVAMQTEQAEVDPVTANGSGNMTGTTDISSMSAQDAGSCFLAATYAVNSDGTFSVSTSGGAVAGIIISSSKFVMFSPATFLTANPTLLVMQK
ncbi:MAG: putative Ig domain-containing protein [Terriglobia bacterium]